jgi:hypothetical protein
VRLAEAAGPLEIENRRRISGWMVGDDDGGGDDDDDGAEHGRGANWLGPRQQAVVQLVVLKARLTAVVIK